MNVNLLAVLNLTHTVLPMMLKQQGGIIINVSSPAGQVNIDGSTLYNVSKAGLSAFSQSLYREVYQHGIHVLDLKPGFTYSEMVTAERARELPSLLQPVEASTVAEEALRAALAGEPYLVSGQKRWQQMGMFINRIFPRFADWLLRRITIR
jgi:short-subunit dehydrogenase